MFSEFWYSCFVQWGPFVAGTFIYLASHRFGWKHRHPKHARKEQLSDLPETCWETRIPLEEPGAEPEPDIEPVRRSPSEIQKSTSPEVKPARRYRTTIYILLIVALAIAVDSIANRVESAGAGTQQQQPMIVYEPETEVSETPSQEAQPVEGLGTSIRKVYVEETTPGASLRMALHRQRTEVKTQSGNYHKTAYYGTLSVGTPASDYTFVFDTGSGHMIIPTTYCHSQTCRAHKRYSRSKSKSALDIDHNGMEVAPGASRDQIKVSFGTGAVTGVFIEDLVCFEEGTTTWHDNASRTHSKFLKEQELLGAQKNELMPLGCMRMRMVAATEMSEYPFKTFHFDGVMGLGLAAIAQSPEFNFIHMLGQHASSWGGSNPNMFAVFLSESGDKDSEIAFGGWAQDRVDGAIFWNDVDAPELGHWLVRINRIRIGGKILDFCEDGSCRAVVDTGTSLLSVPPPSFTEVFEQLRHNALLDGMCQTGGPEIEFELDHFTVSLGAADYSRPQHVTPYPTFKESAQEETPRRKDMRCKPTLMSMSIAPPVGPNLFIFGEPVLRKYYTVYDAEGLRVGFGRANHVAEEVEQSNDDIDEWFFEDEEEEDAFPA